MEQKGINNRYTAAPVLILSLSMLFSSVGWILNAGGVVLPLILSAAVFCRAPVCGIDCDCLWLCGKDQGHVL